MIDPELTALEIVGVAIRAERDAHELYQRMADAVGRTELERELRALAAEEVKHEEWLTGYYREATGASEAPPVPEVRIKMFGPSPHDGMSVLEVLDLAITKEELAEQVYAEASRRASDPSGRRLLDRLVEFERSHARRLEGYRDRLRRDPAWLEDARGRTIQLQGP